MVEASAMEALGGDLGSEASHKASKQKPEEPNAKGEERKAPWAKYSQSGGRISRCLRVQDDMKFGSMVWVSGQVSSLAWLRTERKDSVCC